MEKETLQKRIKSYCEINNYHISGAELRSYSLKELKLIVNRLVSKQSICNPYNSWYKTSIIPY
jgi:hypothetical protein